MPLSQIMRDGPFFWLLLFTFALAFALPPFASKAMVGIVGLGLVSLYVWGRVRFSYDHVLVILCAVAIILGMSLIWTIDQDETFKRMTKILPILVGFGLILSWRIEDRDKDALLKTCVYGFVLGLAFIVIHALGDGVLLAVFRDAADVKPHSTNPALTVVAVAFYPIVVMAWFSGMRKSSLIIVPVGLYALVFSEALAAVAAFILASLVFGLLLMLTRNWSVQLMRVLAAFMFILPVGMIAIDANFTVLAFDSLPISGLHRVEIYNFVLERIAERPITGWGFGSSGVIPGGDAQLPQGWGEVIPLHPHNAILQIWLELGVLGALVFWLLLDRLIVILGQTPQKKPVFCAFAAALWGYIAVCLFSYSIWASWWLAFGIMMVVIAKTIAAQGRMLASHS